MKMIFYYLIGFALISSLFSCSTQQLLVSNDQGDIKDLLPKEEAYQHLIQTDDKLSLSIWNHDDLSVGSVFSIYNSNEAFGKWVLIDENGNAQLPKIGEVHLAGMTCVEAADTLEKLYAIHIKNPIVVAKVLNRHVTVLGEVRMPGYIVLEEEQVKLMDVIGKAQGFTDYADLSQIRLVRNDISYDLDLQKIDAVLSHTIVVHSGDIIIVSAKKGKALDQKAPTLIPFASVLTAVAVFATLILKQ